MKTASILRSQWQSYIKPLLDQSQLVIRRYAYATCSIICFTINHKIPKIINFSFILAQIGGILFFFTLTQRIVFPLLLSYQHSTQNQKRPMNERIGDIEAN